MALSNQARRAIAIRSNIKRRTATQNTTPVAANDTMHPRLLAMCVEAGGFDQNAAYAA